MTTVAQTEKNTKNGNKAKQVESAPAAAPSKLETKELVANFKRAHAAEQDAKSKVNAAVEARSDAVQAIKEALGTGPFQIEGLGLVTIRHRPEKNDAGELTGKATYFFVSMGSKSVTVIE